MNLKNVRSVVVAAAVLVAGVGALCIGPARAAIEYAMSCAQSAPCLEWDNTSSGDAVKGVSTKGNAIQGQTKFKSAGKTAGKAGVLGEDLSASGTLNAGVLGTSTNGAGVSGTSSTYNAVQGLSAISTGVYGQSAGAGGFGAAGRNVSTTHSNNGAGVLADGGPADDGLHAFGNGSSANALYAFSQSATSLFANQGSSDTAPELFLQANGQAHSLIQANDSQGNDLFSVDQSGGAFLRGHLLVNSGLGVTGSFHGGDMQLNAGTTSTISDSSGLAQPTLLVLATRSHTDTETLDVRSADETSFVLMSDSGNIYLTGLVFSSGFCASGCSVGNKQVRAVKEYAPTEAEPTIEDNGEATLVDGRAYVALDPAFANVIDTASQYLVSVTPEGDSNGLYVMNRTPHGFTVREQHGGRANIGFEYRIVAKRFGVQAERLPMFALPHTDVPRHPTRRSVPRA